MISNRVSSWVIGSAVVAVAIVAIASVAAYACNPTPGGQGKCGDQCIWSLKDAKIEVSKTETGAVVTITGDKPEIVTAIQERAASCGKHRSTEASGCCKDAKFEVTNTANGAVVTISSDKPEVVKAIQDCATGCAKQCKGMDPATCKKVCDPAKCPGLSPTH